MKNFIIILLACLTLSCVKNKLAEKNYTGSFFSEYFPSSGNSENIILLISDVSESSLTIANTVLAKNKDSIHGEIDLDFNNFPLILNGEIYKISYKKWGIKGKFKTTIQYKIGPGLGYEYVTANGLFNIVPR